MHASLNCNTLTSKGQRNIFGINCENCYFLGQWKKMKKERFFPQNLTIQICTILLYECVKKFKNFDRMD